MTSRCSRWVAALICTVAAAGCPEDDLQQTVPRIAVCVKADSPDEECNRPLSLGERPMTVTHEVELAVINRGDGTLTLSGVTSSNDTVLRVRDYPEAVEIAQSGALLLAVIPADLGPGQETVEIASNDPDNPTVVLRIEWTGTPKPVPDIQICTDAVSPEDCGTDVVVDFGTVRRSQRESRTVVVRNAGTATLNIEEVRKEGEPSLDGELALATSTRPGYLPPGTSAPVVLLYEPKDGVADEVKLIFTSDDPETATATLTVRGTSEDNLPPSADARRAGTGETNVEVSVGDVVALDGSGSSDPESDPLSFVWTLYAPATSQASLDDPGAGRVTFVPDRAGNYRVELVVTDSLGQESSPTGLVLVRAIPRHALRITLDWPNGGDVDLHLVPTGSELFSSMDAYFENPRPQWGSGTTEQDDPSLLDDSRNAPGHEELVVVAPADGTYAIYAHYFDDAGAGPASVSARVIFNDAGQASLDVTQVLGSSCNLWHIADVSFPAATVTPSTSAISQRCR